MDLGLTSRTFGYY